jgi:regulator of sigma E protease
LIRPKPGADGVYRIGAVVGADVATVEVSDDLVTAVSRGVSRTWEMTVLTFQALGRMIVGEISWRQISGPVTIADAAGQSAGGGLQPFIGFLALISISIAVLNLLPIPMLDGGHLLYYLWEFVRGSPLSAEVQDAGRRMGVALIILLTTVALFNDFSRIAGW